MVNRRQVVPFTCSSAILLITPALPELEFAQGMGFPAMRVTSADDTAFRTVMASELSSSVLTDGTELVATVLSTWDDPAKSRPPRHPERVAVVRHTAAIPLNRDKTFVSSIHFAMSCNGIPVRLERAASRSGDATCKL